jgi:RNA polymerase sigma-70 factor, ECF subfamily
MDDHVSDEALVARHLAGDPGAFDELVRRHRDRAWSVAMRTLGDPTEAADAVQDAFVSAFRNAGQFRSEAKFTTWLHRIVVNACLDALRRRRSRPAVPLDDAVSASLADPHDRIAESDTSAAVSEALARITPEQRAAIVLVDLHGLPVEEAAEVLGVPAGTVKSRCHRGRAELARLLGHLRTGGTPPPVGASQEHDPRPTEREP